MSVFPLKTGCDAFNVAVLMLISWLVLPSGVTYADPPDWAPAKGWRKKQDQNESNRREADRRGSDWHPDHREGEDDRDYDRGEWKWREDWRKRNRHDTLGYSGRRWPKDYGVIAGTCDYRTVGAVVGGVIGGVVGARVGGEDNRAIAILLGSIAGAVVGANVGRTIEDVDRGCIAHSLELAQDGRPVQWSNPHTGAKYVVTAYQGFEQRGHTCRDFDVLVRLNGKDDPSRGRACYVEGAWKIQ